MSDIMILVWGHNVGRAGVRAVWVLLGCAGERVGHGVVIQRGWWWWQGDGDGGDMERVVVAAQRGQWWWHGEGGSGGTEKTAHLEGGWTAWVACQHGQAAHWGCDAWRLTLPSAALLGQVATFLALCRPPSLWL